MLIMNNYETLNNLDKTGELKCLIHSGLMPVKIGTYLEIYRFVDSRIKTGGKMTDAVNEASVKLKMCRSSVFKIIQTLKK